MSATTGSGLSLTTSRSAVDDCIFRYVDEYYIAIPAHYYELISMIIDKNNLHELDTFMFFKWFFKVTSCPRRAHTLAIRSAYIVSPLTYGLK